MVTASYVITSSIFIPNWVCAPGSRGAHPLLLDKDVLVFISEDMWDEDNPSFIETDFPEFPDTNFEEMVVCSKCSHIRASVSLALSALEELVIGKYVPRAQLSFFGDGRSVLSEMILSFKAAHSRIVQSNSLLCFDCAKEDALRRASKFTGIERSGIEAGGYGLSMAERETFSRSAWNNYYQLMNPLNEGDDEIVDDGN